MKVSGNKQRQTWWPLDFLVARLTFAIDAGQLQLTWPQDHLGWTLQAQTNFLDAGLGTNWVCITDSITTNQITIPIGSTNSSVFFRLKYP